MYFCYSPLDFMIIRTKKYRLTPSKYIRIALTNLLRKQWWVAFLFIGASAALYYASYTILSLVVPGLLLLYILFWWIQFFTLTKVEDNQLMFARLFYEINKERIIMFLNTKQGMPIDWKQIKSVREGKDYFLFYISMAQFIYLPHSIFQGDQQVHLLRMLLKNKKIS